MDLLYKSGTAKGIYERDKPSKLTPSLGAVAKGKHLDKYIPGGYDVGIIPNV